MSTPTLNDLGFIHISESYDQAIDYALKRRSGEIRSIKTPWNKFNEITMNGIEWNSLTVIAGRPASGKTLFGSLISREAFTLNHEQDFCVLDFQFEMLSRNIAMREISGNIGVNVRKLNSVEGVMSDEDLEAAKRYCMAHKHRDIYSYERPITVDKMRENIEKFYAIKKKPILITIDHSLLIKKGASEKDRIDTLYNLGGMLAEIRRKLPVAIVILSQLNRDIESVDRIKPGTIGNYVKDSDVFGADALLQFTDVLIGINRPAKYGINYYGPNKHIVDMNTLAVHFLKVRNGDPGFVFFKADFAHSRIHELS